MTPWYLIYCKQGYKVTADRIRSLGVEVFQPMMIKIHYKNSKRKEERKGMFPSYLFLSFDFNKIPMSDIKKVPGVVSFVRFGSQPCIVPLEIIESLKLSKPVIYYNKIDNSTEFLNANDINNTKFSNIALIKTREREIKLLKLLEELSKEDQPDFGKKLKTAFEKKYACYSQVSLS